MDAPIDGRRIRRFLDERLDPVDDGKVFTLVRAWTGSLTPLIDGTVEALRPIINGLTSGNVLHAEEIGRVIDLGTTWMGNVRQQLKDAAVQSSLAGESEPRVDVQAVVREVENLQTSLGTRAPNFPGIIDSLRKLKAAADAVMGRTNDSRTRDARIVGYSRPHYGTPSRPVSPEQLNAQHSRFWAEQRTADSRTPGGTTDNTSAVRDALRASNAAGDMRTRIAALSEAHAKFWASR